MIGVAIEFEEGSVPRSFERAFRAFGKALSREDAKSGYFALKLMLASCEGGEDEEDEEGEEGEEGIASSSKDLGSRRYG